MISNHILAMRITSLKEEKSKLSAIQSELTLSIKALGITKNKAYHNRHLVDPNIIAKRDEFVRAMEENRAKIIEVKSKLTNLYREEDSATNQSLMEVFKEIFDTAQISEIRQEAVRRMKGEEKSKISFSIKDCGELKSELTKAKKDLKEYANKLVETRVVLTGIVQQGCKMFDESAFLKVISPLNRNILPLDYITKIKQKHLLK